MMRQAGQVGLSSLFLCLPEQQKQNKQYTFVLKMDTTAVLADATAVSLRDEIWSLYQPSSSTSLHSIL